jgi:hypothetical protein
MSHSQIDLEYYLIMDFKIDTLIDKKPSSVCKNLYKIWKRLLASFIDFNLLDSDEMISYFYSSTHQLVNNSGFIKRKPVNVEQRVSHGTSNFNNLHFFAQTRKIQRTDY